MKIRTLLLVISAMSLTQVVHADDTVNQSNVSDPMMWGIGIGSVLGGAVGGPLGVVVGMTIGGAFTHGQSLTHKLAVSDEEIVRLKKNLARLGQSNAIQVVQVGRTATLPNLHQNSEIEDLKQAITGHLSTAVYFGMGESDVPEYYQERLTELAGFLINQPGFGVHLKGYADRRGSVVENVALAGDRIKAVRQKLVGLGIEDSQITTVSLGESEPVTKIGDGASYGYDRRVRIEIVIPEETYLPFVTLGEVLP